MKITNNILAISMLGFFITSVYAEETTKTAWGELPLSISSRVDEISNGSASMYIIERKCTNKSETEIIKKSKEQTNKMLKWFIEPKYYLTTLKYNDDSFSQKIKAFNVVYKDNKCEDLKNALFVLAEANNFKFDKKNNY